MASRECDECGEFCFVLFYDDELDGMVCSECRAELGTEDDDGYDDYY